AGCLASVCISYPRRLQAVPAPWSSAHAVYARARSLPDPFLGSFGTSSEAARTALRRHSWHFWGNLRVGSGRLPSLDRGWKAGQRTKSARRNGMRLGVPKEVARGERRVATTPDAVGQLMKLGFTVMVEAGAGAEASCADDAFRAAGAGLAENAGAVWSSA